MKKPIPFGKYYLLERINVGGMAEVFKAKAFGVEGFERLLAVKRILPNIAEDEEFITMFIDEAKIAVQLNHANIAQIFDLGKVDDSYFIALEFIHGKDVRGIFDRCRASGENMPIAQACFIIMKVCEGLDYAHNKRDASGRELGLVHRDVSPQNILISYEGEVKLIDFGIAKAAGKASKTQAGILKGKFGYMSPEQVRGLPLTRGSDIFSVGIVLYELLTGERLFIGESDFSTLEKVRNVEILPPSTYNRKIPEELERIVLKALAKDPEDRYQHAIDLHDELQAFMYTAGEFYSRKDLAAWMKRTWTREIQEETKKLEEYRDLQPLAPPAPAGGGLPPPMAPEPDDFFAAASVSAAPSEPDLDWDDDEIETQLYDREEDELPGGMAPSPMVQPAARPVSPRSTLMGMGALPPPGGASGLPAPGGAAPRLPVPSGSQLPQPPIPAGEPIDDPFAVPEPAAEPEPGLDAVMPAVEHESPVASPQDLAPRKSSGGGKVALVLVLALLILGMSGGALWYFVLRSQPQSRLTVRCAQARCTIQVDDQKQAHASPYEVTLKPGPHMVTLKAPGYKTLVKEVELKPGEKLVLEPPLQKAMVSKGWFNLISVPTGAEVILDGRVLAQKTDIRVEVAVGPHKLQLKHPGYYPWPLDKPHQVDVKPGANPQIKRVLIPRRLQIVISASNIRRGGAKFAIYKDTAKILSGKVPKTVAIKKVDTTASYRVIIRAKGHADWSKKIAFDGNDEISVHAPFSGKTVVEMTSSMVPSPPPYMAPRVMVPRVMVPRPMPPRVVRPAGAKWGFLRINTVPWTKIFVDGRPRGTTPQLKLKLRAGRHRLVLLNNNFGIRKTFIITIRAGKPTTFIRRFKK